MGLGCQGRLLEGHLPRQQGGVSWRSLAPRGSPELVRRAPELIRSPPNWSLTAPKLVLNGLFFRDFFLKKKQNFENLAQKTEV